MMQCTVEFDPDEVYTLDDFLLAAFMKTKSKPETEKHKLFARCQEGARKDVECAFGVYIC